MEWSGSLVRWQSERDGYDYHHREPYGSHPGAAARHGGVMHMQWVSWRRLKAKQALYKMIETVRYPGRRTPAVVDRYYNHAVNESGITLGAVPATWWAPHQHLLPYLDLDHEPWQEGECKRLWAEYGAAKFRGLDLFGVVQ